MLDASTRILAIETSSRWGSAAIGTPAGVLAAGELPGEMRHAAEFVALAKDLLARQHWATDALTHVFVSIGPGSFTGLRIGVTMARTLGWSVGARIVAVPTLDALARNALHAQPTPSHVAVLLDAKRSQVYAAAYRIESGQVSRLTDPTLDEPGRFLARLPNRPGILGEGVLYHRKAIESANAEILPESLWRPQATQVFELGLEMAAAELYTPAGDLVPLYIRRPEAEEKWEKLHPPNGK